MTEYPLKLNRKKIRGWKRRIRQLNRWGDYIQKPDMQYFDRSGGYTYDRCTMDPFYRLVKRHPPLWFYRLIINKFISACHNWQRVFNDSGLNYDLQLQLYDPSYILSKIICYRVEDKNDRITFAWENDDEKPFPYRKFNNPALLEQFDWVLADEELVVFESELEDEDYTAEELLADKYVAKESEKHGIYYAKRIGDIWIGRMKIN